jgi:transposase InsO family protein
MGTTSVGQDARAPKSNLKVWSFEWRKKTGRGLPSNPGCNVALRLYVSAQHDRRYSAPAWNRTGASAKPKSQLEGISNTTLGVDRGCGFLYGGGTARGLKRFLVLFFIDLSTRKVEIAGIASTANGLWMSQIGRRVTDAVDGILNGKRYLIHDRDPLFTTEFQDILASVGVAAVKLPPQSPNLNAYAERFVRSIKESLERLVLFGENSLRTAVREFVEHYLRERHHQGLSNRLVLPEVGETGNKGAIRCRERLGGMLNYNHRAA